VRIKGCAASAQAGEGCKRYEGLQRTMSYFHMYRAVTCCPQSYPAFAHNLRPSIARLRFRKTGTDRNSEISSLLHLILLNFRICVNETTRGRSILPSEAPSDPTYSTSVHNVLFLEGHTVVFLDGPIIPMTVIHRNVCYIQYTVKE
jgi:hypothetical protein